MEEDNLKPDLIINPLEKVSMGMFRFLAHHSSSFNTYEKIQVMKCILSQLRGEAKEAAGEHAENALLSPNIGEQIQAMSGIFDQLKIEATAIGVAHAHAENALLSPNIGEQIQAMSGMLDQLKIEATAIGVAHAHAENTDS